MAGRHPAEGTNRHATCFALRFPAPAIVYVVVAGGRDFEALTMYSRARVGLIGRRVDAEVRCAAQWVTGEGVEF